MDRVRSRDGFARIAHRGLGTTTALLLGSADTLKGGPGSNGLSQEG
jgi:hypothetical protein